MYGRMFVMHLKRADPPLYDVLYVLIITRDHRSGLDRYYLSETKIIISFVTFIIVQLIPFSMRHRFIELITLWLHSQNSLKLDKIIVEKYELVK